MHACTAACGGGIYNEMATPALVPAHLLRHTPGLLLLLLTLLLLSPLPLLLTLLLHGVLLLLLELQQASLT